MKILHVTPSFYPATYYGGPVYIMYGLCNALARIPGVELRVLTTDSASPRRGDTIDVLDFPARFPSGYDVYYCHRQFGADIAPGMFARLWSMIRWADVVHLNAVYSPPTIPTLLICKLLRKPVVWTPQGALLRWDATTRLRLKRLWESVCNLLSNSQRTVLHVTSERELSESLLRIPNARAVLLPNGVDILEDCNGRVWQPDGQLRLLYLGRLHPIKGIENLIKAFASSEAVKTLEIFGDGEPDYRRSLESLVDQMGLGERVHFRGQVEVEEKPACFREADLCVVPSFSENFCMVVVEALAQGVPVLASTGTPWKNLEKVGCGLWVENSPDSLASAIEEMSRMPLRDMGQRGRDWMQNEYSWNYIAQKMLVLYRELIAQ